MAITLPELPFAKDALAPHISERTLEFHYGKHHAGYVTKLNAAIDADASLAGKSLEELIASTKGGVYNNAAQVWNHTFYWQSMSPKGGGAPSGKIADAINGSFGSFDAFKAKFSAAAGGHFGSGWAWVVKDGDSGIKIVDTHDAVCAIAESPVLVCDVWEHAYYLDYQNARPSYVEAWWNLVNWDHANAQL
ncbi:MAG: superoxide dismutase [Sandaracinaceae bacterium]